MKKPAPSAIDVTASQWVLRRAAGLDEAGERQLAAWLAGDPAHEAAFRRMTEMARALERARDRGTADELVVALELRARRRRTRRRAWAGVGAAAAIAFMAGWWLRIGSAGVMPGPALAAESFDPVRHLPDGSTVELDAHSEIAVAFSRECARIELVRGEALFHVAKNPRRPFIVRAAGVEVRAVGTAFNVRLDPAAVEVFVTEGKVGVADAAAGRSLLPADASGAPAVLRAGQRAVVPSGDVGAPGVQITAIEPAEVHRRLSWLAPRLEFAGATLAEAAAEVNRRNRSQIALDGEAVARLRISGIFAADDPGTFSRLVAETLGLDCVRRSNGGILLRKK